MAPEFRIERHKFSPILSYNYYYYYIIASLAFNIFFCDIGCLASTNPRPEHLLHQSDELGSFIGMAPLAHLSNFKRTAIERTNEAQENSAVETNFDLIGQPIKSNKSSNSNNSNSIESSSSTNQALLEQNRIINIGIVGNVDGDNKKLDSALNNINRKLKNVNITLKTIAIPMKTNPLEMSQRVCQDLIKSKVSAVIVENTLSDTVRTVSTVSISFTCGLYNIPIIGINDRDSSLSNKNIHPSFLRVIPPFMHQADVWMDLVIKFAFIRVVVITTSDDQGILSRLSDLIDQRPASDVRIETLIEFEPLSTTSDEAQIAQTKNYIIGRLNDILTYSICRVFLVHATNIRDVSIIFEVVRQLQMDREGFVFILSEAALVAAMQQQPADEGYLKIPNGAISARIKYYEPVDYKIDALNLIARAIKRTASKKFLTDPPNSCEIRPMVDWAAGLVLYNSIIRQRYQGLSGYIAFNELGDRVFTSYDILNIVDNGDSNEYGRGTSQLNVVGFYSNSPHEKDGSNNLIQMDRIVWPGNSKEKPSGIYIKKHLKIVTLQERPFVWIRKGPCGELEKPSNLVHSDNTKLGRDLHLSNNDPVSKNSASYNERISINNKNEKTSNHNQNQFYLDTSSEIKHASVPCNKYNHQQNQYEAHCCEGYCMDLLDELSRRVNFTYEVYIVEDNQYGTIQNNELYPTTVDEDSVIGSGSTINTHSATRNSARIRQQQQQQRDYQNLDALGRGQDHRMAPYYHYDSNNNEIPIWNGLIGELVSKRADMAFAPLSVTPGRAQVIDFSKPFKFHGFSILLRRASMHTTLASFLQPFHNQLWVLVIGVATHVVALSLYLMDRYSTFGRFGMKKNFISSTLHNKHDEHPLHFSSSIWFSWSILLNSGIGEHTPKSLSGRVLGMFWSGFAMIVVASYTANLAAFLVLDSREEQISISGIDDPRLRSGDSAFSFATVKGSAVDTYLQSQVEYINLYRKMEEFNLDNVDDAVEALRNGTIDALIWDSTRLEWETSHDEKCSLGITGELFGRSGYGIGLQKNSYWTKNVTTKLLELHESGFMMDLDRKWILSGTSSCDRKNDDYPETLGISNIAGVFILFACGLMTSFGLIILERAYVNYKKKYKLRNRARSQQLQ